MPTSGAPNDAPDPADLPDPDELADLSTTALRMFDRRFVTSPIALRAVGTICVATAVLLWPDRTDRIFARLLGLTFVAVAALAIWLVVRHRRRSVGGAVQLVAALVGAAVGVFLLLDPDQSQTTIGRLLGAAALVAAVAPLIRRRHDAGERRGFLRALVWGAIGAVLIAFPAGMLATVAAALAVGAIGVSMIVLAALQGDDSEQLLERTSMTDVALGWLSDRHKTTDARQDLYDKILFDGTDQRRRVVRFFTLMTFASVIAAMGVITDSTAVVIGAMLIAPLMTPLMAMAISLVMGWPNRFGMALVIATAGIVLAIGIGVLLGLIAPTVIATDTNSQILARSTPTVLDLIIALAAGAAGAYGLSRPDVSDSLPGVAIAISLVPPLSVVGIAYSQADWAAGNGALLLFLTNMVAILTMGGLTFVVTGVTPLSVVYEGQRRVRTALASVAVLATLVVGALLLNGAELASNALGEARLAGTVEAWLADSPLHRLVDTDVDGDVVTVVVVGPSDGLPDVDQLDAELTAAFRQEVTADVRLVVEERFTSDE